MVGLDAVSDDTAGAVEGGGGRGALTGLSFRILPDLPVPSGEISILSSPSRFPLNGSGARTDLTIADSCDCLTSSFF